MSGNTQSPTDAWIGAAVCGGITANLIVNVVTGGSDAPNFGSDFGWSIAWGIGMIVCLTTAIVRLIKGGDDTW